jgi:glycosyltransferase involved in cell wall biosynthesis
MKSVSRACVSVFNEIPDGYRFELFERLGQQVDLNVYYQHMVSRDRILTLPEETPFEFGHRFLMGRLWSLVGDRHFWRSSIVIVGGYNSLFLWVVFVLCWVSRKKMVMMSDSSDYFEYRKPRLFLMAKRLFVRPLVKTMLFLCCGQANKRYWVYYGVADDQFVYAPYAVDGRTFIPSVHRERRSGVCRFVFVGRLVAAKNLTLLIIAFRQLYQSGAVVELVIVGQGDQFVELCELAQGLPVTFAGGQPRNQVVTYMDAADVFVLPSVDEPWGLVVNEAMLMKKPLILSHAVGASEDLLVEGENGFCFDPENVDELVEKMRFFVDNPEKIAEFGVRSFELVQGFTLDRMLEGYMEAIRQCVD